MKHIHCAMFMLCLLTLIATASAALQDEHCPLPE